MSTPLVPTPVSLGLQSNPARTSAAGVARLINCYVEDAGTEGKVRFPIYACDGFQAFSTFTGSGVSGPPRAFIAFTDAILYVVVGTRIAKVATDGSYTLLTGSISAAGRVTMARNRKDPNAQVGVVTSDGHFYIIESDVITQVTPPVDSTTFNGIATLDGYFLISNDGGEFYITSIDEGTQIDGLNFAAAESDPDTILRPMTRGRDVVLFGPHSTEFWNDTGATDFPFERTDASSYGLYAVSSPINIVADEDGGAVDTIIFAGSDKQGAYVGVMQLSGYGATKISDFAVDRAILAEPDITSIKGFGWSSSGHTFYTIVGSSFSWTFDTTTKKWHERQSSALSRWRVNDVITFNGMVICADYVLSKLYWMKGGLYDGSNDTVLTLKHSNDNGNTWRATRTRTLSGTSNLTQRVKISRLGQSKEDGKVFQLSISSAVIEDGVPVAMTVQPPAVHNYPNRLRFWFAYLDTIPGTSKTSGTKGITGMALSTVTLRN